MELDANDNGSLSQSEWSGTSRMFRDMDLNRDGIVRRDEFLRSYPGLSAQFRAMDIDRNGRLARSEWRGDRRLFTSADRNRDGSVTWEEFSASM